MATTITDVLNTWNEIGVFSYVIPFLLIFAVVFAILQKTKILGDGNNGILAIISVAVGLLSLQFDFVSVFYADIFPKFGIGLSIFLVLIIFLGFFMPDRDVTKGLAGGWIGYVVGIGVVLWALSSWDQFGSFGFGAWFEEYFWSLIILGAVIGIIAKVAGGNGKKPGERQ